MLIEIIIYITLFSALFSGAFVSAFQIVDATRYLQVQEDSISDLYFFSARLDAFVQSDIDWNTLCLDKIVQSIPDLGLSIESFSSQILETATSSSQVLLLTLGINQKTYTFSYVKEK